MTGVLVRPLDRRAAVALVLTCLVGVSDGYAQRGRGGGRGQAPSARAAAPRDFTGYWVSVVTEHWHLRMMVPPKGEYSMLPLTAEARRVADAWDLDKDRAQPDQCMSYGPPNLMRVPGRLHLHWADDNTLQLDTDSGTQTRMFRFGDAAEGSTGAGSWQGVSAAAWETAGARARGAPPALTGQLRVRTTQMRPGYLRKNGVPYSENAVVDEYFETFTEPNGDRWLIVTSIVADPRYLTQPYATTYPFKKIPDGSGWDPTPCRADEPR
jgi:hypothetical protein